MDDTPASATPPDDAAAPPPKRVDKSPDELVRMIGWDQIEIREGFNVRNHDAEEAAAIVALADSILEFGLRQRIKVRRKPGSNKNDSIYEVRQGHRRLAALQHIRLSHPDMFLQIPVLETLGRLSKEDDDRDFLADMIADAESRPLKAIEKLRWFEQAKAHGVPKDTIMRALKIGTDQQYENYGVAAALPEETKAIVAEGTIPLAGAIDLARVEGPERAAVIIKAVADEAAAEVKAIEEARAAEEASSPPLPLGLPDAGAKADTGAKAGGGKKAATGKKAGKVSGEKLREAASRPDMQKLADAVGKRETRTGRGRRPKVTTATTTRASAQEGYGKELLKATRRIDEMLGAVMQGEIGLARDCMIALVKWAYTMRRDHYSDMMPDKELAAADIMAAGALADVPSALRPLFKLGLLTEAPPAPEPAASKKVTSGRGPGARPTRAPKVTPPAGKATGGRKKASAPAARKRGGKAA